MSADKLEKIKSQVEFYFGDANFRVDKFLREQSLVNDGYIPIKTIVSFNKLRDLEATVEDVLEAVKDSKVVEVKDEMVKKVETDEYLSYIADKDISKRVVYIDGFDTSSALEDIKEMLSPHMEVLLIRMRRDRGKGFSGSVFAELKSAEEAEKAILERIPARKPLDEDEEKAKKQKSEEKYLVIMRKDDYLKEKDKISGEKKEKQAREALEKEFVPRLFRYQCEEDLDIKTIKKLVKNCAFVDTKQKVVRMKHAEDFSEKKFEEDGKALTLLKMEENEAVEYCKGIKIAPKEAKTARK